MHRGMSIALFVCIIAMHGMCVIYLVYIYIIYNILQISDAYIMHGKKDIFF